MHGRRHWLLVCAGSLVGWTLFVLILATQSYVAAAYRGRPVSWALVFAYPAVYYAIWALLTPPIYALVTRVPPPVSGSISVPGAAAAAASTASTASTAATAAARAFAGTAASRGAIGWARFAGVHLLAGIAVSLIQAWLFVAIMPRVQPGIWPDASANERVLNVLVANVHSNLLIYVILIGAALAVDLYRRYRARELRASQLEARLARAELQMLKLQLQPHFLFNTLHAIQALVHEDPEAADRTIARLADLLRMTLESHGTQEVSLRRELAILDCYLQIEQTRLGDRLRVSRHVDDTALDGRVPVLILQPLVENAIKHGVAPRAAGGTVVIRAWREASSLVIAVSDDGPGLGGAAADAPVGLHEHPLGGASAATVTGTHEPDPPREGVGLANTRARLEQLYGRVDGTRERLQIAVQPPPATHVVARRPNGEPPAAASSGSTSKAAGDGFTVTLTIPWRAHADAGRADALPAPLADADVARAVLERAPAGPDPVDGVSAARASADRAAATGAPADRPAADPALLPSAEAR